MVTPAVNQKGDTGKDDANKTESSNSWRLYTRNYFDVSKFIILLIISYNLLLDTV